MLLQLPVNKTITMKIPATEVAHKRSGHSRRQMTRSAPAARTSTKVSSKSRSKEDSVSISIDDIYQSAERERLVYSAQCRRQNLEHAQSQFQYFREDTRTPSRPNTSASKYMYINSSRRDMYTPISVWSEPVLSRPSSTIRHPELRGVDEYDDGDDVEDDMSDRFLPLSVTVSPVSRDCCEIIGPQMCHECRKNRIRQLGRESSNAFFPNLQTFQDNLTTTAIAKKYLPGLSYTDIEDKLTRGEIARPSFLRKTSAGSPDSRQKSVSKKVTIVDSKVKKDIISQDDTRLVLSDRADASNHSRKTGNLYFANIRDLNYKIITGSAERSVGFKKPKEKEVRKNPVSLTNHFPTFISPRKLPMNDDTKYKVFYEPPLVAKESQSVEPAFFAGCSSSYKLPDKLPEELVFVDKEGNRQQVSGTKPLSSQLAVFTDSTILEEESETPEPGERPAASQGTIQEEEEQEEGDKEEEGVKEVEVEEKDKEEEKKDTENGGAT